MKKKNEKDQYIDGISSLLSDFDFIPTDAKDSIMNQLTRVPKTGKHGDIMTVGEFKNLKVGDKIYHKFWDDDNHKRSDEFDVITDVDEDESDQTLYIITEGAYTFEIRKSDPDDLKIEKYYESCGWSYTIYKSK